MRVAEYLQYNWVLFAFLCGLAGPSPFVQSFVAASYNPDIEEDSGMTDLRGEYKKFFC